MSDVSPGSVAALDQKRAILHGIVDYVRRHQAICDVAQFGCCPGPQVLDQIDTTAYDKVKDLLALALCELARQPAPPTTLEGIEL